MIFRKIWRGWKSIAKKIGRFQTGILLFLVYFLIVGPIAIIARLLGSDFLDKKTRHKPTYWQEKPTKEHLISNYEHQF